MNNKISITLPADQLAYLMGMLFSSAIDNLDAPEETEEGQIYDNLKGQLTEEQFELVSNHPNYDF